MRILILFNPVAGAGKGAAAARRIRTWLRRAGYETVGAETGEDPPDDLLAEAGAAVVVGGDGALRQAAEAAIRTGTPIYHFPCGTVNLFARELGMDRRRQTLLRALERRQPQRVDAGVANGRLFLLMASLGYDAEVVHDLAGHRGASISHGSYLLPMARRLRAWQPPRLEITLDGLPLEKGGTGGSRGYVIVANCRRYMWRLNPAGRAVMADGRLDVLFFPLRSKSELVGWTLRCLARRHLDDPRLVYRQARNVKITSDRPQRIQLDGDPLAGGAPMRELRVSVQPGALRVLMP